MFESKARRKKEAPRMKSELKWLKIEKMIRIISAIKVRGMMIFLNEDLRPASIVKTELSIKIKGMLAAERIKTMNLLVSCSSSKEWATSKKDQNIPEVKQVSKARRMKDVEVNS